MFVVCFLKSSTRVSRALASYAEALAWVHDWNDGLERMGIELVPLIIVKL